MQNTKKRGAASFMKQNIQDLSPEDLFVSTAACVICGGQGLSLDSEQKCDMCQKQFKRKRARVLPETGLNTKKTKQEISKANAKPFPDKLSMRSKQLPNKPILTLSR